MFIYVKDEAVISGYLQGKKDAMSWKNAFATKGISTNKTGFTIVLNILDNKYESL